MIVDQTVIPLGYYALVALSFMGGGLLAVLLYRRSLVRLLGGILLIFMGMIIFISAHSYFRHSLGGFSLSLFIFAAILTKILVIFSLIVNKNNSLAEDSVDG